MAVAPVPRTIVTLKPLFATASSTACLLAQAAGLGSPVAVVLTEQPNESEIGSLLGGLGDGVDFFSVPFDGEQRGGRGKVAIPKVVAHALKMPDSFSGGGVEGDEAVGKQIIADAVGAVEVEGGGAGRDIDDAASGIERHSRPVVGGAA